MARKLPPLNAIKAFEATARHGNFSKAAVELSVTQGAISKQVRILEEYVGAPLFLRKPQQVTLTPEGKLYLPSITLALDTIEHATDQLPKGKGQKEILHINILPSLSSRWLIPLLDDFRKSHPRINVNVSLGDGPVNFDTLNADIAIRAATGNTWKQFHAEKIMDEELIPVCAPEVKLGKHPIRNPQDLQQHTLLQHTTRPGMWPDYLEAIGYANLPVEHPLGFEHFFMLIEAALDGLGVALIPRFLIEKELKQKRLVIAFKVPYQSPYAYYFICPKPKMGLRKTRVFIRWLMKERRNAF